MGIHLLCCLHGNEHTKTHDAIRNTFVVSFHVGWEQLHEFPSTTFNSFHWWMNIMFTKYNICILTEFILSFHLHLIIVDPT
jgi:hypothetical protein